MRDRAWALLVAVVVFSVSSSSTGGVKAPDVPQCYQASAEQWVLENSLVRFALNRPTALTNIRNGREGQPTWVLYDAVSQKQITSASRLATLEVDGKQLSSAKVLSVTCTSDFKAPNGHGPAPVTLVIDPVLTGQTGSTVHVVRYFEVYPSHPFIRYWGTADTQENSTSVSGCELLRTEVTVPEDQIFQLFHVEQWTGSFSDIRFQQRLLWPLPGTIPDSIRMGSYPGYNFMSAVSAAWFAAQAFFPNQSSLSPGGFEFNGKVVMETWVDGGVSSGQIHARLDPMNHTIPSSPDSFVWPPSFIGVFRGDWDEAGYVTQRFTEAILAPPLPDSNYPWVQYDSWSYGEGINETNQLAAIDVAGEIGLEVFVLDLGWARQIGDWRPDPTRFPRGLAPLVNKAHSLGIRFGLHMPLAQASVTSPVLVEHPNWAAFPLSPSTTDYFGATALCLGNEPARSWLTGEILRMIKEYNIDYIVQDGEDMVKRCLKSNHTHNWKDFNYANSQQGLDMVLAEVRKIHPSFVFENCEDGGAMLTYKTAQLYDTSISVDNSNSYSTRQGVYGQSYYYPPRYSARYIQDMPGSYTYRSGMFGGPLILQQVLGEWDSNTKQLAMKYINEYKKYRALIRDAKIYHLLPPVGLEYENGYDWDAIMALNAAKGVIFVYRSRDGVNSKQIPIKGLIPSATYSITFVDTKKTVTQKGQTLLTEGVTVSLSAQYSSEVLEIRQI